MTIHSRSKRRNRLQNRHRRRRHHLSQSRPHLLLVHRRQFAREQHRRSALLVHQLLRAFLRSLCNHLRPLHRHRHSPLHLLLLLVQCSHLPVGRLLDVLMVQRLVESVISGMCTARRSLHRCKSHQSRSLKLGTPLSRLLLLWRSQKRLKHRQHSLKNTRMRLLCRSRTNPAPYSRVEQHRSHTLRANL